MFTFLFYDHNRQLWKNFVTCKHKTITSSENFPQYQLRFSTSPISQQEGTKTWTGGLRLSMGNKCPLHFGKDPYQKEALISPKQTIKKLVLPLSKKKRAKIAFPTRCWIASTRNERRKTWTKIGLRLVIYPRWNSPTRM